MPVVLPTNYNPFRLHSPVPSSVGEMIKCILIYLIEQIWSLATAYFEQYFFCCSSFVIHSYISPYHTHIRASIFPQPTETSSPMPYFDCFHLLLETQNVYISYLFSSPPPPSALSPLSFSLRLSRNRTNNPIKSETTKKNLSFELVYMAGVNMLKCSSPTTEQ